MLHQGHFVTNPVYSSIPDTAGNEHFAVHPVVGDQITTWAIPHQINAMYESAATKNDNTTPGSVAAARSSELGAAEHQPPAAAAAAGTQHNAALNAALDRSTLAYSELHQEGTYGQLPAALGTQEYAALDCTALAVGAAAAQGFGIHHFGDNTITR